MENNNLEDRIDFINDKRALHIHAAKTLYTGNFIPEKQLTIILKDINNYYNDQIDASKEMANNEFDIEY